MTLRGRARLPLVGAALLLLAAFALAQGGLAQFETAAASASPPSGAAVVSPAPTVSASPRASPSPTFASPTVAPSPSPSASPSRATLDPALAAALDATLERLRAKAAIPGVSATIVFPDGSTWTGTAGLADVKAKRPVTADTAFAIASMSKTFTAAAVLELVAEGRLRLDEPVAPRLPGVTIDRRITVRMLLDHTSGLFDYFLNPRIDKVLQSAPRATWTLAQSLSYVAKPYFRPGTGWHYSNTNYLLLGALVERITGHSLASELRARFLGPLGLDSTWYQAAEKPRAPVARGYRFAGTSLTLRPIDVSDGTGIMPFRSVVTAAGGAGSVAATSRDLAEWARALYGGRVLDPETYRLMVDDIAAVATFKPRTPYGLGVQAVQVNQFATLGHSGRLLGFRGVVRYLPFEDVSIAVLTNQNRADPAVIARGLLALLYPPPAPAPSGSALPTPSQAHVAAASPSAGAVS